MLVLFSPERVKLRWTMMINRALTGIKSKKVQIKMNQDNCVEIERCQGIEIVLMSGY
jgi:hypothetical protein